MCKHIYIYKYISICIARGEMTLLWIPKVGKYISCRHSWFAKFVDIQTYLLTRYWFVIWVFQNLILGVGQNSCRKSRWFLLAYACLIIFFQNRLHFYKSWNSIGTFNGALAFLKSILRYLFCLVNCLFLWTQKWNTFDRWTFGRI